MSKPLVLVAVIASFVPRIARADPATTARLLGELSKGARCTDATSPWRPWCIAADGWASGQVASLPKGKALVGITIEIEDGASVADALSKRVTLSALAFGKKSGKPVAKITNINPENDREAESVAAGVMATSAVLKGKARTGQLPKDLSTYVATLPAGASYPVTRGKTGWTWAGQSDAELRRVGAFWVTIEQPRSGRPGVWVGIYTDKVK